MGYGEFVGNVPFPLDQSFIVSAMNFSDSSAPSGPLKVFAILEIV